MRLSGEGAVQGLPRRLAYRMLSLKHAAPQMASTLAGRFARWPANRFVGHVRCVDCGFLATEVPVIGRALPIGGLERQILRDGMTTQSRALICARGARDLQTAVETREGVRPGPQGTWLVNYSLLDVERKEQILRRLTRPFRCRGFTGYSPGVSIEGHLDFAEKCRLQRTQWKWLALAAVLGGVTTKLLEVTGPWALNSLLRWLGQP